MYVVTSIRKIKIIKSIQAGEIIKRFTFADNLKIRNHNIMNISIIVAIAENNGIGKDNDLLVYISEDLKRFKKLTTGNVIIMGKKTYFSLPRRPLPNRVNMVISDDPADRFEGCTMAYSIEEALNKMDPEKENFIIGGGSIYKQFMPYADKLYITRVHESYEADIFFPDISDIDWEVDSKEDFHASIPENAPAYSYIIYKRKN